MTSNLKNHDNLQQYIRHGDQPLWHRVYCFFDTEIDLNTLADEIESKLGIKLRSKNTDETGRNSTDRLDGFLSACLFRNGAEGTCSWCLEERQPNTRHHCVIITLFNETDEATLEKIIQEYHQNVLISPEITA